MHPSGAFRVQPHFVRSLARSVLRTPRLRVSLRDSKKKGVICGHGATPAGLRLLTQPRHDHDYRRVCAHMKPYDPSPNPSPCAPCGHMCAKAILTRSHAHIGLKVRLFLVKNKVEEVGAPMCPCAPMWVSGQRCQDV